MNHKSQPGPVQITVWAVTAGWVDEISQTNTSNDLRNDPVYMNGQENVTVFPVPHTCQDKIHSPLRPPQTDDHADLSPLNSPVPDTSPIE